MTLGGATHAQVRHAALPPALAEAAIETGWTEPHPMAQRGFISKNIVMVYGPRDEEELEVVPG